MDQLEKAKLIARCLDDKKGRDITILDIGSVSSLGDYFVIASGGSAPQLKAMADEVLEKMAEVGAHPLHVEGYNAATWILMDFGDVIAHIFHQETRDFYGIERLWTDAKQIPFTSSNVQGDVQIEF